MKIKTKKFKTLLGLAGAALITSTTIFGGAYTSFADENVSVIDEIGTQTLNLVTGDKEEYDIQRVITEVVTYRIADTKENVYTATHKWEEDKEVTDEQIDKIEKAVTLLNEESEASYADIQSAVWSIISENETIFPNASEKKEVLSRIYESNLKEVESKYKAKVTISNNRHFITIQSKEGSVETKEAPTETQTEASEDDDESDVTFEATTADYKVTAVTDAGVFPEGTEMKVTPLNEDETFNFLEAVYKAEGIEYSKATAADISFYKDGKEIEPEGEVKVTFTFNEEVKNLVPTVAHLADDGDVELVDADIDGKEVVFTADEFSTYGVVDNAGTTKYLTMRGSAEKEKMKLIVQKWDTKELVSTFHDTMSEGIIHTSAGESFFCGNSFNDFYTGTFTAHNGLEYFTQSEINKIAWFQFAIDNTPEFYELSTNDRYFIKQGAIWAMTNEIYHRNDHGLGTGNTMSVRFDDSNMQRVWEKCYDTFFNSTHGSDSACSKMQNGEMFQFKGKYYKWNSAKITAYVNEAYGFDKSYTHDGKSQSALQVQYDVDEVNPKYDLPVTVYKVDKNGNQVPYGDWNYSGAKFEITYKDANGGTKTAEATSDETGKAYFPKLEMYLGAVTVKETKAPNGLIKSDIVYTGEVKFENNEAILKFNDNVIYENQSDGTIVKVPNDDDRSHSVQITKKDIKSGDIPQGDASLEGTTFSVTNKSAKAVKYNNRDIGVGEVVSNLSIRKDGDKYKSPVLEGLMYGTYEIKEVSAGEGYVRNNDIKTVVAHENNKLYEVEYTNTPITGTIQVEKKSTEMVDGKPSGDADLAGIEFTVYNNSKNAIYYQGKKVETGSGQSNSNKVTTLTTHYDSASGKYVTDESDKLPYGTYTIVETKTNGKYRLTDSKPHIVKIREDGYKYNSENTTALVFKDEVVQGNLKFIKLDLETKDGKPQGDADLANIEFTVYNNSSNTNDGKIMYKGKEIPGAQGQTAANKVDSFKTKYDAATDSYYVVTDKLPYGTYTIKETASNGKYRLTDGTAHELKIREDNMTYESTWKDEVVKGKLRFIKIDKETEDGKPQGDANLAGIEFTVYNNSDNSNNGLILYNGKEIPSANGQTDANIVCTVKTQYDKATDSYFVDTGDLPYGTYTIKETKTNDSYLLTDGQPKKVELREDNKVYENTWKDYVIRGKIDIIKLSAELMKSEAQGGASLENLEFKVYNYSNNSNKGKILYNTARDKVHKNSELINSGSQNTDDNLVCTLTTIKDKDADGNTKYHCETGWLPYGTYKIVETKTNSTYYLDIDPEEWAVDKAAAIDWKNTDLSTTSSSNKTVNIRKEGNTTTIEKTDNVKRGDLMFNKKGETSKKSEYLPNCAFSLTLYRTKEDAEAKKNPMETHVIVTDDTGTFDSTFNLHNNNTNGNDGVLGQKMIKTADLDFKAGTWFSAGENGSLNNEIIKEGSVDDNGQQWGALPYGWYRLTELRCESNKEYNLAVDETFEINERYVDRGRVTDLHTFDDQEIEVKIGTTATSVDGMHLALVTEENNVTEIIDKIAYEGLVPDKKYVFVTWAIDKATGEYVSDTVETVYTSKDYNGTATVKIPIDTSTLRGKDIVIFEEVYVADKNGKPDGEPVATHKDRNDEGQSIQIPDAGTTVTDETTGTQYSITGQTVLKDKVTYKNLVPGKEYTVEGELMDKETGESLGIKSEPVTFTATEKDGEVYVDFNVDASALAGKEGVVFEEIKYKDVVIVAHKDLEDENQTFYVPEAKTTAGSESGHVIKVSEEAPFTDTIAYKNLEPETEYKVVTWVVSKEDGAEITEKFEKVVKTGAERNGEFVIDDMTINTAELKGKDVVVFEEIYKSDEEKGDILITDHKDIEDEGQTLHVPDAGTTATTETDKIMVVGTDAKLTDTITYTNLDPDTEYKVTTWVVKKSDGNAVTEPISGTYKTGEERDGEFKVDMTFDTTTVKGEDIVVFEEIYDIDSDIMLIDHKDVNDEGQTVSVPDAKTTATDKNTTTHTTITGKTTIVDEVKYTNLIPGETYTIQGELMDKETGEPLGIKSEPVEFEAEERNGSQFIEFTVDTSELKGRSIVVFEDVIYKDVVIVAHKDLEDDEQTVNTPGDLCTTANGINGKTVEAGADVTITDRVEYKNLTPGETYTLKGWVVDETGNTVSKEVTKEFTPETKDGYVDMELGVNTSGYAGQKLVVFEEAYTENKTLITEHKDLTDEGQTVYVEAPVTPPRNTPNTGDNLAIGAYAAGAAITASIIGLVYRKRRRTQ